MRTAAYLLGTIACLSLASCSIAAEPVPTGTGSLRLGMEVDREKHPEIKGNEVWVVPAGKTCAADPVKNAAGLPARQFVATEQEFLPLEPGTRHVFFDALFVLDPGYYHVCAQPMEERDGKRCDSAKCKLAEGNAKVIAEATTEILLVSQCEGDPSGGLDVIVELNDPPYIEGLVVTPSKFVCRYEKEVWAKVTASDPNGDLLKFYWTFAGLKLLPYPDGPAMRLPTDKPAGTYTIKVTAEDTHGAQASLTFPLHISECGPK